MTGVTQFVFPTALPTYSHRYILPPIRELIRSGRISCDTVVDLGCGNGALIRACFADATEGTVFGIDGSETGIEQARRSSPGVDFRIGDLTGSLEDHPAYGRCDLVISTEVIEHLYDPRAFAQNCFGFLRPGGNVVISTPYHGYLKNLTMALAGKFDKHFDALRLCGHIKFWSRSTLSRLFSDCGFRTVGFYGCGRAPWLWNSMIMVFERP